MAGVLHGRFLTEIIGARVTGRSRQHALQEVSDITSNATTTDHAGEHLVMAELLSGGFHAFHVHRRQWAHEF